VGNGSIRCGGTEFEPVVERILAVARTHFRPRYAAFERCARALSHLVTDKTVTVKADDGCTETKQNYFITTVEDPDYVDLCYTVPAKNAVLLRQVVLSNFDKLLQAVEDHLAAHKDSQHDARGFVY
jgi:hypothetical protein